MQETRALEYYKPISLDNRKHWIYCLEQFWNLGLGVSRGNNKTKKI